MDMQCHMQDLEIINGNSSVANDSKMVRCEISYEFGLNDILVII